MTRMHTGADEPAPVGTSRQSTLTAPVRPNVTHNNGPAAADTAPALDPSGDADEPSQRTPVTA